MTLFKNKYRIETTRLNSWDYSNNGYYYVTICTKNRDYLFGEILNENMRLNENGIDVLNEWNNLPVHYKHISIDEFIVMPNHVHGIIIINHNKLQTGLNETVLKKSNFGQTGLNETGLKPVSTYEIPKIHSLSEIIRGFKTFSSRKINERRNSPGIPVWQARFYDRIIKNEKELNNARNYIINNPY